jgi:probable HAF family extracellular repeat protein
MDLNDANMVAGWGTTHGSTGVCCGVVRGFRWSQAGGMQPLVPFEASDLAVTRGYAINSMGHVAGVVINAAGVQHAAVWFDPAVPPYLIGAVGAGAIAYDINDVGQVVGVHATGPFVWSAQDGATLLPNLGGSWNVAYAINNLGVVVGWSELPDGTIHPFRWTSSGGIEDLGLPPGATNAYARAISKSGRIAVSAEYVDAVTADVTSRLFLWADGQWFDSSSADLGSSYAGGINDELQIAGGGLSGQSAGMTAIRWDVSLTPATSTFAFTGFFAPIQNLPVVNRAKAGQGIPVKFSLGGDQGLNIFAPNYPASQQIACDGTAPVDEVEATVAAGGSSLSYDAVTGVYSYVWKSDASWAGTCRSLTVRLTDGTERSAHFRFVR